jgi:hypothetical protein
MKETLEEAAERHYINCIPSDRHSFITGAKWQAEKMYTEEEVIAIVEKSRATGLTVEYLIEQFKKK